MFKKKQKRLLNILCKSSYIIKKNISLIFDDKSMQYKKKLKRQIYLNMMIFMKEFVFFNYYKSKVTVKTRGKYHIDAALEKRKGLIILFPHLGAGGLVISMLSEILNVEDTKINIIIGGMSNLENFQVKLYERLKKARINVISKKGASIRVYRALKKNEIVLIALDQKAGKREKSSTYVKFMGKNTTSIPSIITFKEYINTPILPSYTFRVNSFKHRIIFCREIDWNTELPTQAKLQHINCILSRIILKHPEQWLLWQSKRWG